MKTKKIISKI